MSQTAPTLSTVEQWALFASTARRAARRLGGHRIEPWLLWGGFLLGAWFLLTPVMTYPWSQNWDETFYLAQASSLAHDFDYDIGNDLFHTGLPPRTDDPNDSLTIVHQLRAAPDLRVRSTFAIGSSLVWTPAIGAGRLMRLGAGPSAADLHVPRFPAPLRIFMGFYSAFIGGLALFGAYLLARLLGLGARASSASALICFFLTPAAFYCLRSPGYAHAASAAAVTLLLLLAWRYSRKRGGGIAFAIAGAVGLAAGLVYTIRWADVAFLIVPFSIWTRWLARELKSAKAVPWHSLIEASVALLGFVLVGLFQWIFWRRNFGEWFTTPQGEGFMTWSDPRFADMLWRSYNSFLPWAPAAWVAIPGLILVAWKRRFWGAALLAVTAAALYLAAVPRDVEGGWSFGSRRLVSLYPVLVVGMAAALHAIKIDRSRILTLFLVGGAFVAGLFLIRLRETGVRHIVEAVDELGWTFGANGSEAAALMNRSDYLIGMRSQLAQPFSPVPAIALLGLLGLGWPAAVWLAARVKKIRAVPGAIVLFIFVSLALVHGAILFGPGRNADAAARAALVDLAAAVDEGDLARATEIAKSLHGDPRHELQASLLAADLAGRSGQYREGLALIEPLLGRAPGDALVKLRELHLWFETAARAQRRFESER